MATVDLQELVNQPRQPRMAPRTPWMTRYVLPSGLVLGFAMMAAWSVRGSLARATPVTVVPVLTSTGVAIAADTPLFRSAGWIEPRPTPTFVTAIAEGVVERLLVVEGQEVQEGDPVAELIKRDAELSVENADADLALKTANLASTSAHLDAARAYWKEPIERQAVLAEAEATLAKVRTDLSRLPALVTAATAKLSQSQRELESKRGAESAVPKIAIERVRSEVAVGTALIEELTAQEAALQNEVVAISKRRDILQRQLELRIEEQRRLKDAEAQYDAAAAQVRQAEASLGAARLKLQRMTVRATVSGKVLSLIARPGSRLMGFERASLADSSTVISMYEPDRLQIRADVRLENVPLVREGQFVRIETPALPGPISGTVLALTSLTDIQKNTLQVKIAIDNPPAVLKPEMLVEATFLAVVNQVDDTEPSERLRMMIPVELVDSSQSGAYVWVADRAAQVAMRRSIQVGSQLEHGLIEVTNGLSVGDRIIAHGRELLSSGCLIVVSGESTEPSSDAHHHSIRGIPKTNRLP